MKRTLTALATALLLAAPALAQAAATEAQMHAIAAAKADYEAAKRALEREEWKSAISHLQNAARQDPTNADIYNLLGYSHRRNMELDAAFTNYRRALDLNPRHRGAYEYMGRAYLMAGLPEKAKEALEQLEKYCPEVCAERDTLKKAITTWDPWNQSVRAGRSY